MREWGDIVEGGEAKLGGGTGGIFSPSVGGGSHCCPSPFSLAAVPSPSGSGEAFLFMFRGCFPLSGGVNGLKKIQLRRIVQSNSNNHTRKLRLCAFVTCMLHHTEQNSSNIQQHKRYIMVSVAFEYFCMGSEV